MAVAYTDLAAAVLTALKTADSAEQQAKAMAHLHDAMNVASPSHRANSPPELLLQARSHMRHGCDWWLRVQRSGWQDERLAACDRLYATGTPKAPKQCDAPSFASAAPPRELTHWRMRAGHVLGRAA